MKSSSFLISRHRLPSGYAGSPGHSPHVPVEPRPAATLALLRGTPRGLETLLLQRSARARFIPGAHVFPGGGVDSEEEGTGPGAFRWTALRETFEETGILFPAERGASLSFAMDGQSVGSRLRRDLMGGRCTFARVLRELHLTTDPHRLTFIAHWVTPEAEAYRYDTRFFALEVPPDCRAYPDGRELVRGRWMTPQEALDLNRVGRLPMVVPTLHTLQALTPFSSPEKALATLGERRILRLLPVMQESAGGIRVTLHPTETVSGG